MAFSLGFSLYLELPIAPAIIFGILSKRVTAKGALASVLVGSVFCTVFEADELVGHHAGARFFPFLHTHPLAANYTYRGLWGSIAATITLFAVSAFTKKTDPKKLTLPHYRLERPGRTVRGNL